MFDDARRFRRIPGWTQKRFVLSNLDATFLLASIFPAYVANAAPVVLGGGSKVDAGTVLQDGRRLFGEGKTVRGIAAAVACGTLAGLVLLLAGPTFLGPALTLWQKLAASFLLSVGAMAGDLAGSFLKRRLGYPDGTSVEVLDQLSFLAGAIAFAYPFFSPTLPELAVLAVMTYALHKLTNWAAHKLALKKVPW